MSKTKIKKTARVISTIGLVLATLGIADATYLTVAHYSDHVTLACPTTSFINCAKVTSSQYSNIHGIPAALLGLIFFLVMFFLQLPQAWLTSNKMIQRARLAWVTIGMLSVFWFVYVELHLLHAICLYCTGVHILTFGLLVTTFIGTELVSSSHVSSVEEPLN